MGAPADGGEPARAPARPRLLLMEDDPCLRRMLAWEFEELGYEVRATSCCAEARVAAADMTFTHTLLDVDLPDGDGIALAREFAAATPDTRLVLYSGAHGAFNGVSPPATVLACVAKPVSAEHLDRLLRGQTG